MPSYSTDRRGALKILGAIGATCACPIAGEELFGRTADEPPATAHVHNAGTAAPLPTSPSFFSAIDFKTISRIADLIIPQTDTPGAINAGVPFYIDLIVSRNTQHQELMNDGLRWLDQGSGPFLTLNEQQQLAVLEPLCLAADSGQTSGRLAQFFLLLKGLTADGYYTSQTGLLQELAYKGNTVRTSFPDCVHEH